VKVLFTTLPVALGEPKKVTAQRALAGTDSIVIDCVDAGNTTKGRRRIIRTHQQLGAADLSWFRQNCLSVTARTRCEAGWPAIAEATVSATRSRAPRPGDCALHARRRRQALAIARGARARWIEGRMRASASDVETGSWVVYRVRVTSA